MDSVNFQTLKILVMTFRSQIISKYDVVLYFVLGITFHFLFYLILRPFP